MPGFDVAGARYHPQPDTEGERAMSEHRAAISIAEQLVAGHRAGQWEVPAEFLELHGALGRAKVAGPSAGELVEQAHNDLRDEVVAALTAGTDVPPATPVVKAHEAALAEAERQRVMLAAREELGRQLGNLVTSSAEE